MGRNSRRNRKSGKRRSGGGGRGFRRGDDVRLRFTTSVICRSQARGTPLPAKEYIELVGRLDWKTLYRQLADLAALLANDERGPYQPEVLDLTVRLLPTLADSRSIEEREVARYVASQQDRPIANELAVMFVQAMALLYGKDGGEQPKDGLVAYLLLVANDYCFGWHDESDVESMPRKERAAADTARALQFNQHGNHVHRFVRGAYMLRPPPPRDPQWKNHADWAVFQEGAFGCSLADYVARLAGPLYVASMLWGGLRDGQPHPPALTPSAWLEGSSVPADEQEAFLIPLCATREEAVAGLKVRDDGLPIGVGASYRKPFVLVDGTAVAASPWVVREHLRGGLWAKHLKEAKRLDPKNGAFRWFSAFGDLFEVWCRAVALSASCEAEFPDDLLLSSEIGGGDEIEDVVVLNRGRVALISAKSRTMSEGIIKQASSRTEVLRWFNEFLFDEEGVGEGGHKYKDGAIRLLNAKVADIRRGRHEPKIRRNAEIFPVIVSYDDFGADNVGIYRWVAKRCREEGLLRQNRIRPVTFATVATYESMFAIASRGMSVIEILEKKTKYPWSEGRLEVLLSELRPTAEAHRLRLFDDLFQETMEVVRTRLFPEGGRE